MVVFFENTLIVVAVGAVIGFQILLSSLIVYGLWWIGSAIVGVF